DPPDFQVLAGDHVDVGQMQDADVGGTAGEQLQGLAADPELLGLIHAVTDERSAYSQRPGRQQVRGPGSMAQRRCKVFLFRHDLSVIVLSIWLFTKPSLSQSKPKGRVQPKLNAAFTAAS